MRPLSHVSPWLDEPNRTKLNRTSDTAGPSQAYFNDDTRLEIITAITTTARRGIGREREGAGEGEEEVEAGGAEHMALPHFVHS